MPVVLLLSAMILAMGQDLPPPPEVGVSLDPPAAPASTNVIPVASRLSDVAGVATNETDRELDEPLGAWSKPRPKQVVMEDLEAPTDDQRGAPRSSSNLFPMVLVGAAALLLAVVLLLGFLGRRYNRRFED